MAVLLLTALRYIRRRRDRLARRQDRLIVRRRTEPVRARPRSKIPEPPCGTLQVGLRPTFTHRKARPCARRWHKCQHRRKKLGFRLPECRYWFVTHKLWLRFPDHT